MFNEYSVFHMMKLRKDETERAAKDAWKFFEKKNSDDITLQTNTTVTPCCQCACA